VEVWPVEVAAHEWRTADPSASRISGESCGSVGCVWISLKRTTSGIAGESSEKAGHPGWRSRSDDKKRRGSCKEVRGTVAKGQGDVGRRGCLFHRQPPLNSNNRFLPRQQSFVRNRKNHRVWDDKGELVSP